MTTEAEDLEHRAKQRAQEIQAIEKERHEIAPDQDLGSPAEDDGADAATRFAHEVKRAEERAAGDALLPHGPRPR